MPNRLDGGGAGRLRLGRLCYGAAAVVAERLESRVLMAADPAVGEFFASDQSTSIAEVGDSVAVADVQFDHYRGLYSRRFRLGLSTATSGALIRYTTDGSMPTPTTGTLYTNPFLIDNTTVVHAMAYKAGLTSTPVHAESYIFPANVLRQPELIPGYPNPPEPINNPGPNAVNVPLTYGMDPKIVNDPQYAQQALDGLSQIATLSIGVDAGNIFGPSGFYDTPRDVNGPKVPISFEYIDPNNPGINLGVGAAITAHSKEKLKRSFHIHFSSKFGPSKLNAPIFDNAPFGGSSATSEFDDLILRAGNNRSWATTGWPSKTTYTEDEYVRDTQIAMTGQGVHGTFVHLYINGIYWGLYNLVERPDDGYGEAYFGSKEDDYFSLNDDGVKSGDATRWNYMMGTLAKQDMSVSANYAEMQKYLNVTQFADYLIGQWFCGVSDWPDRNFWAGGDTAKAQPFQFFAWDGEEMINTVNRFPSIPHGPWVNPAFGNQPINNTGPIVELWTALKRSPDFMTMFTQEVYKNVTNNGPLTDANALARWNALNASISSAIVDESARWGDATISTGRPTYTKNNAWNIATQEIANDLQGAVSKFLTALSAEGYLWSSDLNAKGTLLIRGTNAGDAIDLRIRQSDGRLVVHVGDVVQSFRLSKVKRIHIYGYGGNDAITVGSGIRGAFADGGAGSDTILGGDGHDTLIGNPGADHIEGGAGNDNIAGGGGDDYVLGGLGDDILAGNGGSDTLTGAAGNDRLFGGPRNADLIRGGRGRDTAVNDPLDLFDDVELFA
jgi:Ca2+-binding RTX toxin-like protein